jgi:hypothetical protein
MLPTDLKPERFNSYPPEARKLVTDNLATLRRLPVTFLPSLLREAIDYDYKFPAERKSLDKELSKLSSLSSEQFKGWFQGFSEIHLSPEMENFDWVSSPAQFVENLSSYLWTTHQLDAFRKAATEYGNRLHEAIPSEAPPIPRLGITVVGQGVSSYNEQLFRKLRPHGAYFKNVKPEDGLKTLLDVVASRAKVHSGSYAHWYIDGGHEATHDPALTSVSYGALEGMRTTLLTRMRTEVGQPGMGPEALRTTLAQMHPADLGLKETGDSVLDRFRVRLLTEGSGTQIYSTTFAQWAAREALRRAQPLTLLVRFAPRQRQRTMNELLSLKPEHADLDPVGSLVDADMGAYYNWLNQQRLAGAEQSAFMVWFENHGDAVAISPAMPRGTESTAATDLKQLLSWML